MKELGALTRLEPELFGRYPAELSGGQAQRVGLVRALMLDPPCLLMDEPLGALDPITRAHLQDDLASLFRALGKTVLFVTHDLAEGALLADRLVLLREGRVVQAGSFAELATRPADPFVDRVRARPPDPAGAAAMIALVLAGALAATGPATVGSKAFPESWILADALVALCREEGLAVEHRANLGGTEIAYQALTSGAIDAYPEYTGTIAEVILKRERSPLARGAPRRARPARARDERAARVQRRLRARGEPEDRGRARGSARSRISPGTRSSGSGSRTSSSAAPTAGRG